MHCITEYMHTKILRGKYNYEAFAIFTAYRLQQLFETIISFGTTNLRKKVKHVYSTGFK